MNLIYFYIKRLYNDMTHRIAIFLEVSRNPVM